MSSGTTVPQVAKGNFAIGFFLGTMVTVVCGGLYWFTSAGRRGVDFIDGFMDIVVYGIALQWVFVVPLFVYLRLTKETKTARGLFTEALILSVSSMAGCFAWGWKSGFFR